MLRSCNVTFYHKRTKIDKLLLVQPSSKANEQVQETSTATFSKKFALPLILDKRYTREEK